MFTFSILLVTLSMIMLVFGLAQFSQLVPTFKNEVWRDRPPFAFRVLRPVILLIAPRIARKTPQMELELTQNKLHSAGVGYALRAEELIASRWVGAGIGLLLYFYVFIMLELSTVAIVACALLIPLGFMYPDIWIRDRIKIRHLLIEKQFPFFLELLVLAMRAGLNFSSALSHAVIRMPEGPVRQEFTHFLRDTRTGKNRRDALKALELRIDQPAVSSFISAVNQTEALGGEMGTMLITQAKQRRAERFSRAETAANQAPVKMIFPLTVFLFPITIIIVLFPLVITARDSGVMDFFSK